MTFKELHTERLILRKLGPEEYNHIHTTMDDSEIADFLGLKTGAQLAAEKDKFVNGQTTFRISFARFLLIEKASGLVIGGCGFHNWYPVHNRAEIGYDLKHEDHKRKGYMTEALQAVLHYGFNEMGLHRVEALAAPDNVASIKLLEKFGFTFEGTLRQHYNVDGINEDSVMYSLLRNEYNLK